MPFGHNCEHADFDSCVRTMTGRVEDPKGYCASLMRATEEKCKKKTEAARTVQSGVRMRTVLSLLSGEFVLVGLAGLAWLLIQNVDTLTTRLLALVAWLVILGGASVFAYFLAGWLNEEQTPLGL